MTRVELSENRSEKRTGRNITSDTTTATWSSFCISHCSDNSDTTQTQKHQLIQVQLRAPRNFSTGGARRWNLTKHLPLQAVPSADSYVSIIRETTPTVILATCRRPPEAAPHTSVLVHIRQHFDKPQRKDGNESAPNPRQHTWPFPRLCIAPHHGSQQLRVGAFSYNAKRLHADTPCFPGRGQTKLLGELFLITGAFTRSRVVPTLYESRGVVTSPVVIDATTPLVPQRRAQSE